MVMTTKITVVDGADGLTPDMLRQRPKQVKNQNIKSNPVTINPKESK